MTLPKPFITKMALLLQSESESFFKALKEPKVSGLRIHPLKISKESFINNSPFDLSPILFYEHGFYYNAKKDEPGKHPYHHAGVYYIQEPSAMVPVKILQPQPGQLVLDLCAAPGGKSTQLALMMKNEGLLVSNEIHPKRAKILAENIERLGVRNCVVTNETPERLADHFPQFFDKILVDAPCSGEGMFRKDEEAIKYWSEEHVLRCARTQKEILKSAYKMLRPGGELVYSTCTFSPEENEQVIEWFVENFPNMSLMEVPKDAGMEDGRVDWTLNQRKEMKKCIRLWPHKIKGEGHFVAKLKKENDEEIKISNIKYEKNIVKQRDLTDFLSFEKQVLTKPLRGTFSIQKQQLFLLPEHSPDFGSLKVIRKGLHLGQFKKNRFEPSHHLALSLSASDVKHVYEMSSTEQEWKKYIRGETMATGKDRGWVLLTVDQFPIGWGKETKGILKNFYPKGLRIHF